MHILITGSSGFIGSSLVRRLAGEGHLLVGLDLEKSLALNPAVSNVAWDIANPLPSDLLPSEIEVVIHCAGVREKTIPEARMFAVNSLGCLNLLEWSKNKGIKRFIFLSSGAVYGYRPGACSELTPLKPGDFYGLSKQVAELMVKNYSRYFQTTILRLFFPYGPGRNKGLIPGLLNRLKTNSQIILNNEQGSPQINPIYIDDLSAIISLALNKAQTPALLNLAGPEKINITELSELLGKKLNRQPQFHQENHPEISNLLGDISLLEKSLNYQPKIGLSEGLGRLPVD